MVSSHLLRHLIISHLIISVSSSIWHKVFGTPKTWSQTSNLPFRSWVTLAHLTCSEPQFPWV